ncbi:MAG: hypothetical protein Kow0063_15780 [Anaerolineae bacterium]
MSAGVIALVLAGVLGLIVIVAFPNVLATIRQILGGSVMLVLGLALIAMLVIAIFEIDVDPFLRRSAVLLTGHRLVDFFTLLPPQYEVREVEYEDTDGDGKDEWVVFYQYDLDDGRRPYWGVVYDFDRGDPLAIFPYRLLPPDRDYLSEGEIRLVLEDIVGAGEAKPVPELMVYGRVPASKEAGGPIDTDLTIFRHIPNSFEWEFPRDEPRRYQVIGAFRGDGGVRFNKEDKSVIVINRAGYDRSQLAIRNVYVLDQTRETYMSLEDPNQLAAPASSQVVFAFGMPDDILSTPYPEKLVLGFYEMLAAKNPEIEPREFLTGQALIEYDRNNLAYFGFGEVSGRMRDVNKVAVNLLSYAPFVEQVNPSVTVLGEEPRFLTVSIGLEARVGSADTRTPVPIQWVTTLVDGKWKMERRLQ